MGRKKITASREEKAGFMGHTRCPLCSGEQGEVEKVIENYPHWSEGRDQFRSVPVRKCRNCGAFHDTHGKLIEDFQDQVEA